MTSPSLPERSGSPHDSENTYRLTRESPLAPEGIVPPPPVENLYAKRPLRTRPTKTGTLIGFNALVFITSICVMTLELTASRLIGKHVGSSLYTWTSVIGVVLAGITLGNWFGGWLADRYDKGRALSWMYFIGSISCGSVLWLDQLVATMPRPDSFSWPTWVVTVVAAIFLLPALALGTTSPLVASMALERSSKTGSTVGNVYAWGAFGSIVGTFLTGFYLIDVWGTRSIVGMTAATLAILAVLVAGGRQVFRAAVVLGWLQLLGWTMLAANSNADAMAAAGDVAAQCVSLGQSNVDTSLLRTSWSGCGSLLGDKLHEIGLILRLRDDPLREYHDESNYSDIRINDTIVDGRAVKSLRLDKLIHSYYDVKFPTALHYEYEGVYAAVTKRVAWSTPSEKLTILIDDLSDLAIDPQGLPDGVTITDDGKMLTIERPTAMVFSQLLSLAPEANYWKAVEHLYTESNKRGWKEFSSVNLEQLPDGIIFPDDIGKSLRHDEGLGLLITYQPLTAEDRDRLINSTERALWYRQINELRRGSLKSSACFYGGGGFVFPRWFLAEFPGASPIDVAELDPAVHEAVKKELGLTKELEERIRTTIGDARNFVDDRLRENSLRKIRNEPPIDYDFIYADAFNDFSIPWHLTTREFLQKTHDLLSERGVFQANIIDVYPRTTFPSASVGFAEVEYAGRLPNGVVNQDLKRDVKVSAARAFSPLEVTEILTNRYRLQTRTTIMLNEIQRLTDVTWPERKLPTKLDESRGYQPTIDLAVERENWRKAILDMVKHSQKKREFEGTIPESLLIAGGPLEGWVSGKTPFEFVEAYRIDGEKHLLGFRGYVTDAAAKRLIELDPKNREWVNAVTVASEKSRSYGPGRFMGRYVAAAAQVFPNIYLFSTSHQQPDADRDTFVMVCSRQPLDLKSLDDTGDWKGGPFAWMETQAGQSERKMGGQMESVIALSEGQILTDDFAPVDNLLVPVFDTKE